MRDRAAPRIGAEIVTFALVLACLAGTFGIILALHRQAYDARRPRTSPVAVVAPSPPSPAPASHPPKPRLKPSPPAPAPVDPTPAMVAAIASDEAAQRAKAESAAAEADRLAKDRHDFETRQASLKERTELVRKQVAVLDARADNLEGALADLSHYRDILARDRENAHEQLQLAQARSRDGFAILPYKGPNGTWQRPIPIECRDGTAQIMPNGPRFSLLELSGVGRARSSAMVAAISLYLDRIARAPSPDGAAVVPYLLFIIRPDGIRPYYEARAALEPFGIRFGYELVDQDEAIEYPDLADPAEWSEEVPLPFAKRWGKESADALVSAGGTPGDDPFLWASPAAAKPGTTGAESGAALGNELNGLLAGLASASAEANARAGAAAGEGSEMNGSGLAGSGLAGSGMAGSGMAGGGLAGGGLAGGGGSSAMPGGGGALAGGLGGNANGSAGHYPGAGGGPGEGLTSGQGTLPRGVSPEPGAVARALAAIEAQQAAPLLDPRGAGLQPTNPLSVGAGGNGIALGTEAEGTERGGSAGVGGSTGGLAGASGSGSGLVGTPGGTAAAGTGTGTAADGSRIQFKPRRTLDLVVACNAKGVTIHPGGYRLSRSSLAPGDNRLVGTLRALVERRAGQEPDAEIRPRLTFLVEPGGQDTYWTIRKQTTYAGLDWPVHLRVAEGATLAGAPDPLKVGDILR